MKKSDLYREWGRVLDMCEGTEVSPGLCLKLNGLGRGKDCIPKFNSDDGSYEFAVAILDGRAVFVGDKLYAKSTGESLVVSDSTLFIKDLSWNPPKNRRNVHDPMRWAEGLIEQLPGAHEGKITWLMRHGDGQMADDLREKYDFKNGA